MSKLRDKSLQTIAALPATVKEAIAIVIETADAQGGYVFDGESSSWEDDVQMTLNHLAREIREAKP